MDSQTLFEKHSVDELQGILVKIKAEADKKKYDLRRLVGASYMDVIDAANAIGNMKSSTELLVKQLERTGGEITAIKDTTAKEAESMTADLSLFGTAAKVRLLVITPEQIWNSMESMNYLNASHLFLIARIVYSSLQQADPTVKSNFPIIRDLWESIGPLKPQIIEKAALSIKSCKLSSDRLCASLCSVGILKDVTLQDMFHLFLDNRRQHILSTLTPPTQPAGVAITNEIFEFIRCIRQTSNEIYDLFFIPMLSDYLKTEYRAIGLTPSVFARMYSDSSNVGALYRFLPDSAKHLSVSFKSGPPLSSNYVLDFSSMWLRNMTKSIDERLILLLGSVKSGLILAKLRADFFSFAIAPATMLEDGKNELAILNTLESIWDAFFKAPFFERTKTIIESTFARLFIAVRNLISQQIQNFAKSTHVENIAFEIWNKRLDGLEVSNIKNTKLLAAPLLSKLDQEFASIISTLVTELLPLMELQQASSFSKIAYSHFSSALTTFQKSIGDIIGEVEQNKNLQMSAKIEMCSFVGMAISSLSRNLSNLGALFHESLDQEKLAESFKGSILQSRRLWRESVGSSFSKIILDGIEGIDWNGCKAVTSLWENVDDSSIQSLPCHPSSFLSKAIFHVCEEINRLDAFSMEKYCNNDCLDFVFKACMQDYISTIPQLKISKNGYLQIYFDVLYLSATIGSQEESPFGTINRSGDAIAPVLELITPHLQEGTLKTVADKHFIVGIQKACTRSSSLFSVLLNIRSPSSSKISPEKNHMILPIATSVPRFSLLPVATPSLGIATTFQSRSSLTSSSPIFSKSKPRSVLSLQPHKRAVSHLPITRNASSAGVKDAGNTRVQGLMNAVAGLSGISHQPKAATEFLSSASSFIGSWTLGSTSASSPTSSPKKL